MTVVTNDIVKIWRNEKSQLHREDGPAIDFVDCSATMWYFNGNPHREDGPAIIYHTGEERWYIHGTLHRSNGPAVTYSDGQTYWYINGRQLTNDEVVMWRFINQL